MGTDPLGFLPGNHKGYVPRLKFKKERGGGERGGEGRGGRKNYFAFREGF